MSIHLSQPAPASLIGLTGGGGAIETLVGEPAAQALAGPAALCVIAHPHPLMGGTMNNKVAWTLARAAQKTGYRAVRFNFRGVGESAGEHDDGQGESEDFLAVVKAAADLWPVQALVFAGFSFGAYVALKAAVAARGGIPGLALAPAGLVTVAPPFSYFKGAWPERPACPWWLGHGEADEVVAFAEAEQAVAHFQPPPTLHTFLGADHFFHGRLGELEAGLVPFLTAVRAGRRSDG